MITRRAFGEIALLGAALPIALVVCPHEPARAADAGQPAPAFKLPSTVGRDIALSDYRGKKWVLLEFYGADFSPT